jgi:hypothetical protein
MSRKSRRKIDSISLYDFRPERVPAYICSSHSSVYGESLTLVCYKCPGRGSQEFDAGY